jgi:hypothetical protein
MTIAMMHTGSGTAMPLPTIPWPITNRLVAESETAKKSYTLIESGAPFEVTQSAAEWAAEQWGGVDLGDARLNRRAVQIGASMAAHPSQSLPQQMGDRAALRAAYGMFNHPGVTLEQLSGPHWERTRRAAGQHKVVLFVQDTTELDYTHHPTKKGVGPIGNNKGQGLLLHSTLGVVPGARPQILGVAHQQVVLRRPADQPRPKYTGSAEGQVWAKAAEAVGAPPEEVWWVHVGDRASDDFRFMHTCRGKHFLVRVARNRILEWEHEEMGPEMRKLVDFARTLPAQHRYTLDVPTQHERRARTAQMCLAWAEVTIPAPSQGPPELRHQPPITAWVIRAWEVDAPPDVEAIEWILLTSVPTKTVADAQERVEWYTCRWLTEDYHQCLKTGCAIEKRQFDHGDDICRLLGVCGPIAVRLLQMRNVARVEPQAPAGLHVDPLVIEVLAQRLDWTSTESVAMGDFWRGVAQLGGHLGRRGDGPPGWKTVWRGWQYLDDLVTGARLYVAALTSRRTQGGHGLKLNAIPNDRFH